MRALFTAATGMEAQQVRIDTVAHNLANVTTSGFKKGRPEFQDLFYEVLRSPGATTADGASLPTGAQVGHGVKLGSVGKIYAQGQMLGTTRALDVAIDGDGFFQVQRPGGETFYTRDGAFQLDRDGNMVNSQGFPLVPNIQVPTDALEVTILDDGTVSALVAGSSTASNLGRIELARFANPAGLRALGGNLLTPSEGSGDPETGVPQDPGFGSLSSGFLESSNVNIAEELVQMILAQRAFELNSRVIQTGDQMLQAAAALAR